MKKSFLVLAAAFSLGLAACGKQPAPSGPSVPTEAGKVTFYFEMADVEAAVEIPSYCNAFLTGAFLGKEAWPTKPEEVVTMKRLSEDSNIYYGQWEGDYTTIADKGYQLTLGYSADSGSMSTGVNWSFKSEECKEGSGESGMDNLQFELSADGLTANLGTHHWEEAPGPVVKVQNVTIKLTLDNAVPEWTTIYMPGSTTSWVCNAGDAMTPDAARKVWTKTFAEINQGNYEIKVIAEYTQDTRADGNSWGWGNVILDNGEGGNYSLNILRAAANNTIDLNEKANEGEAFEFDAGLFPDPTKISKGNFSIKLGAALDTTVNAKWYIIGSFTGWKAVELSISEDKKELSISFPRLIWDTNAEFGVCSDDGWHIAVKAYDDTKESDQFSNLSYTVPHVEHKVEVAVSAEEVVKMNTAIDPEAWVNVIGVLTMTPSNAA